MKFRFENKPVLLAMVALAVIVALVIGGGWYVLARKQSSTANNSNGQAASDENSGNTKNGANNSPASNDSQTSGQPPAGESPLPSPQNKPATDGQAAKSSDIAINGDSFSPANITIKKGAAVTWTNKDSSAHAIAADDDAVSLHSPQLQLGQSYTYTFAAVGTYHYHCAIAPNLTGTVTVTN